ncbi:MAG: GNAT family N-acetyltransferase [Candidatus Dactylopiibacterium sp.]|nr:GNAT family N-acetyltransferase [Candidatus Dactylopiibacterium sp.]
MPQIRLATPADHAHLLALWRDSVLASHAFLSEPEVDAILPCVRDAALPALEVWLIEDGPRAIVGFMGLDGASLEALFVAPAWFGRGAGRLLVAHARRLKGALRVSVNEQNPAALRFYLAQGFEVVGRSPTDADGRPYPLLHLAEPARAGSAPRSPQPPARIHALAAHHLADLLALYPHLHANDAPQPPAEITAATWQACLSHPGFTCFGAFVGDALVASATLVVIPNLTRGCRPYGLIENVVTHAAHRRRGHGMAVVRAAQAQAWALGCYKLMLLTGREDAPTLDFYRAAGFRSDDKLGFVARPPD